MKRSPMPARKVALKAKTPLRAGKPLQRHQGAASGQPCARAPMRQVSRKKAAQKRTRAALVKWLIGEGVGCEVCPELARTGITIPGSCSGLGGLHERRKRSSAGSTEYAPGLVPCCNASNLAIECEPALMRERFGTWLVLREGDPEWEACGMRAEPVPVAVKRCQRCGAAFVTIPPSGVLPCGHRPLSG